MSTGNPQQFPSLSVIVCSYNRSHLLEGCIAGLREQVGMVEAELIVINDGSTDDTQAVIESAMPAVVGGGWSENRGLNAARNEGYRIASAPIVLYFDDDQLPPDGYLRSVLEAMKPGIDGVGGPLRDTGGGLRTCQLCSLGDSSLGDEARWSDRLIGGNMALRTSAFERFGVFDERLSGRGDETEWFLRASSLRFRYEPDLWVWHRRDSFSVRDLCKYAYRQGKTGPIYDSITSAKSRGRSWRSARFLGHTLRYRCSHGLELLCRELGSLDTAVRARWESVRPDSGRREQ